MSLRQVNPGFFPYFEGLKVDSEEERVVVYEFDQDVLIHNLSIGYSSAFGTFKVEIVYPLSFSSNTVAESSPIVFDNTGGTSLQNVYLSPFSLSGYAQSKSPLPHVLPKGSLVKLTFTGLTETVDVEVFLVASSAGISSGHHY